MTDTREFNAQTTPTMVGFFPHEIISMLDGWTMQIPVDLSRAVEEPVDMIQQLEIMGGVVDYIESRQKCCPENEPCPPLTETQHAYLAYWITNARRSAYKLFETQPDTRLSFDNHPRALISSTLMGSWSKASQEHEKGF